jgi:hypothetical protein
MLLLVAAQLYLITKKVPIRDQATLTLIDMSTSPSSTRGPHTSANLPASNPRSTTRGSPLPSGIKSGSVNSAGRQMAGRTVTRATGTRALRTGQSSENTGQPEQMNPESLQEVSFQTPFYLMCNLTKR